MNNFEEIIHNLKIKNFDKALELCSSYEDFKNKHIIFNIKGVIYTQKGNYQTAEEYFLKSSNLDKKFVDPVKNLYLLQLKNNNFLKLLIYAKKLINFDYYNPSFNYFLAYALELNNETNQAIEFYKKNIDLNGSEKKKSFNNIASIYFFKKKYKDALEFFLKAYDVDNKDRLVANNIFRTYLRLRDLDNCYIYFNICEKLDKNYKEFIINKCEFFFINNKIDEAIAILEKYTHDINFLLLLTKINFTIGKSKEGLDLLNKAKINNLSHKKLNTSLSFRFLSEGHFKEGFDLYENRSSKNIDYFKNINEWCGESLDNKNIIVFNEQGLGDAIQFSKYLIPLSKISNNVYFFVQESIFDLFDNKIKNLEISSLKSNKNINAHYKISLGSLIKYFYDQKINSNELSIKIDEQKKNYFKTIINSKKLSVGIVWSGYIYGFQQPYRSIPLEKYKKILDLDVDFYCLQNEIWQRDLDFFKKVKLNNFSHLNFKDISALISNLDLILTVDTSFLHIASSLNKETWGLLSIDHDWRWDKFDKINPYNNLKFFRQKNFNNWDDVLENVYNLIETMIK